MTGGPARTRARLGSLTTQQRVVVAGVAIAVVAVGAAGAALAANRHPSKVQVGTSQRSGGVVGTGGPAPLGTPPTPRRRNVAPLTGLVAADPRRLIRPALAVKIDNLDTARGSALPQTGLDRADVVFEEVVEADITRLVAVFHSMSAEAVGPVRSARTTDVHLLPQLRTPLIAWSGGNGSVIGAIRGADVIDVGAGAEPSAYFRDDRRHAPHNLYVHPDLLWRHSGSGDGPPRPLFVYRYRKGAPAPGHSLPARGLSIKWGPGGASAPVSYRWEPMTHSWDRSQRGRPDVDSSGTRLSPANVVVLVTRYRPSPADTRSPEAITTGSGEAFVFTSGRVAHGRWTRRDERSPASLVDDTGHRITLVPGPTWVELPRTGSVTTIR